METSGGSRSPDPHGYDKSSPSVGIISPRGTVPLPGIVTTPRGNDQVPGGQEWSTGATQEELLEAERDEGQQTRVSSYGSIPG